VCPHEAVNASQHQVFFTLTLNQTHVTQGTSACTGVHAHVNVACSTHSAGGGAESWWAVVHLLRVSAGGPGRRALVSV